VELLLNLCWLAVSAGALVAWHANRRRKGCAEDSERVRAEGVALVCALILLFFPISITDDLHPEIFLTADCLSHRRDGVIVCISKTGGHPTVPYRTPPCAAVRVEQTLWPALFFAGLTEQHALTVATASTATGRSRAPPLS
jgi:hypothetical protein